jgi:ribosomal RNA-processing protein 17
MPPPKKKLKTSAVAEISFDPAAREEYLTGFHKRKQARIKHAQEQAAKMANEERLKMRAQVSEIRYNPRKYI